MKKLNITISKKKAFINHFIIIINNTFFYHLTLRNVQDSKTDFRMQRLPNPI
jgi:hypothetical protein